MAITLRLQVGRALRLSVVLALHVSEPGEDAHEISAHVRQAEGVLGAAERSITVSRSTRPHRLRVSTYSVSRLLGWKRTINHFVL